jgi:cytochrome c oxidase subunit 2
MRTRPIRASAPVLGAAGAGLALVLSLAPDPVPAQQPNGAVERGQKVFMEQGCYGCHTVGKLGTRGIAPDLSHIGARHDLAYLAAWLRDPTAKRPTAHMPKIEMTGAEADAVAAYLASLR